MKENEVKIVLKDEENESFKNSKAIDFRFKNSEHNIQDRGHSPAALKSRALQSAIQQNDDLMARVRTLTLRTSELESEIDAKNEELENLRQSRDQLKEQMLIVQEKNNIFRERVEQDLIKAGDLREENEELLERLSKVERAFRRLFKYREKIRQHIPNFRSAQKKSSRLSEVNEHLKVQVEELSTRIQTIHREMTESQSRLIGDYEEEIQVLNDQVLELSKRAKERDSFKSSKVEFENKNIELERQLSLLKENYSKESYHLKEDLSSYRKQTKELLVQCETLKSQLTEKTVNIDELSSENHRLTDQVESLQVLWKEKQEELERASEKNRSLQKLNQDISSKLNEARRDVAELKNKLEAEAEMLRRIRLGSTQ
ncbi:MAG TPA: hypothetical protein DCL41_07320 [Bdellovibrionales bacterium]|nr:hypothetical protein [Pseudobdellovibrionaceae bacterium]HAG91665.1 hypothetical protein [Bdellovibrionales bacterium]|tara:strand:- start:4405 stop:5520 length:1116 start_codon:yes stop_codon:yes gene_type:complete